MWIWTNVDENMQLVISVSGNSTCIQKIFFYVFHIAYRIDLKSQRDTKRNYDSAYIKNNKMGNTDEQENGAQMKKHCTIYS